ncbi:MAG: hypothetical protein IPK68_01040 [Bdellovibrionales bacterium]|nr:hypothetical protein [Bdellovibrionales bacterium]
MGKKEKSIRKLASQKGSVRKAHGAYPSKRVRPQVNRGPKSTRPASLRNQAGRVKFPIAAIGASAGGLQSLKDIFSSLPVETGMAFVVIQHLDPKRRSMSGEILSRSTKMPVIEIEEGMRVRPNRVYVIPPNCNLGLLNGGRLQILPRTDTASQHLPLDFFFRSLAEERKSQAIGVVLSGTACDGTQGLLAIKNEGGITLAQDPLTAKFDGMPRSSIASGAVDLICPPTGIAAELARIAKHSYVASRELKVDKIAPQEKLESLAKIFSLLRAHTGVNFAHYKNSTIQRRLARRMLLQKTEDPNEYAAYLENNSVEVRDLFADLLINVTNFFRDKNSFEVLKTDVLPKYMKGRDPSVPFVYGWLVAQLAKKCILWSCRCWSSSVIRSPRLPFRY